MSRLANIVALAAVLLVPLAQAADTGSLLKKKPHDGNDDYYLGVGMFDDMMNVNLEAVTRWGNFLVRAGTFKNINTGISGNVSWRKPLTGGDGHDSGYFVGAFAGQVIGDNIGQERFQRVGGGAELGYHWVNAETRKEITVGLGSAEAVTSGNKTLESTPTIFFDFVVSLGL